MARNTSTAHVTLEGEMELHKMIARGENKYLMVNLLAKRARELNEGCRPLVQLQPPYTHLDIAIAEGLSDTLKVVRHQKEPVVVDLVEHGD